LVPPGGISKVAYINSSAGSWGGRCSLVSLGLLRRRNLSLIGHRFYVVTTKVGTRGTKRGILKILKSKFPEIF